MNKLNKIIFIVATQYDNMGDLLINKCLIDNIAEYGEVYLDTKKVPDSFKKILLEHENVLELNSISRVSLKGKGLLLLPFLNKFKFTHLFKSPGPFGGAISNSDKIRYYIFYYIFRMMKQKKCNSYLIGNDLILKSDFDLRIFKKFSTVLKGMYVRSKSNLECFKNENIEALYSPDLCFLMNSSYDKITKRKIVGISFRDLQDTELKKEIINSLELSIEFFIKKGYDIEFFYQVTRDKSLNLELFGLFKQYKNITFKEEALDWSNKDYYRQQDFVISNRLHVLLLAQSYNVIPLGLVDDNEKTMKINNIFKSVGLEELIFKKIDTPIIEEVYSLKDKYKEKIELVIVEQKKIFKKELDSILKN